MMSVLWERKKISDPLYRHGGRMVKIGGGKKEAEWRLACLFVSHTSQGLPGLLETRK